jgi:hypothetical protein
MQLDQVEMIGAQSLQAALDAGQQRCGPPIFDFRVFGMPALGEQVVFLAPAGRRLTDQFLALKVALCGIDDVESGIQSAIQQLGNCLHRCFLKTDLSPAKAQHAYPHVRLAQLPHFHD